jgi:hypothetical protein
MAVRIRDVGLEEVGVWFGPGYVWFPDTAKGKWKQALACKIYIIENSVSDLSLKPRVSVQLPPRMAVVNIASFCAYQGNTLS